MPEKVTIPVGRKLDTLFFLHAAAWTQQGGDLNFAVRYPLQGRQERDAPGDGQQSGRLERPTRCSFPKEENTFTTAAVTVPVPQFGQGTVYRMEWNAPADRRAVEIESIEFIGGGKAVPILLGNFRRDEW